MQKTRNEELNRLSAEEFKTAGKMPVVLVLDNVRSLHNVGSAFRTSDAFLIEKIILCGVTGTPPNKEIQKTALGATSTVVWEYNKSTIDAVKTLKASGYTIYSVEQVKNSMLLNEINNDSLKYPVALVFGNEVYGVDQEVVDLSDGVIEIPQLGTKHSLNISVSIGIVLWELLKGKIKSRN